jgi:hypothetical protein
MDQRLSPELQQQYKGTVRSLVNEFRDRVPSESIEQRANHTLEQFHGARVMNFVPALVYRYTREELQRELQAS